MECDLVHMCAAGAVLIIAAVLIGEALTLEIAMAAIARAFHLASRIQVDMETLETLFIFCGVGLTVSLVVASYGVDLSAGF